jgi:class 3 adenylate cyclase
VRFAQDLRRVFERFDADTGLDLAYGIGVASGTVISGVLASDQLTYSIFGDPAQTALALSAIVQPGEILLDHTAVDALGPEWEVRPVSDLVDLRGEPIHASTIVDADRAGGSAGRHGSLA